MLTWRSAKAYMDCRRPHPGQQTPKGTMGASWLLRATTHSRTMETCHSPGVVQPICGQFWYQVYWKRTPSTFIWCTRKGNIWNCGRLDRQPKLWDYMEMELGETPSGSCYASICHKTTHKIQHCPLETTALPVFTQYHQIWQRQPIALSSWQKSSPRQSTKEMRPTNCLQLPILCASSGSYYINGMSEAAPQQAAPTENTMKWVSQFLDNMGTHPDAIIRYRASDMILNVHSDASYLSSPKLVAVLVVTSSLAVSHTIETRLNWMEPFISHAPSSSLLLLLQQKQNWVHYSWMHKKLRFYGSSLRNSAIHNHQLQYTLATQQQLELSTTQSNNKYHKQWRWDTFGY